MRIDLFEFIDGLFRGIVYFFYNLIGTAWMVLRHPIRGPALLHRANGAAGQRQVGGLTFLFVAYLAALPALWVMEGGVSLSQLSVALSGRLDTNSLWNVFLGSFASTVLVDSVLRLGLRWRQRDLRRRQAMLARAEYAMFLAALLVTPGVGYLALRWYSASLGGHEPALVWLPYGIPLFVLACAAAVPVAAQLRPRRRARPPAPAVAQADGSAAQPVPGISVRSAAFVLGLGALALAASVLDVVVAFTVTTDDSPPNRVTLQRLSCHILEDRPFVDALLHNGSRAAVIVDPGELTLFVKADGVDADGNPGRRARALFRLRAGEDQYGSATVVRPGETALVRAWLSETALVRAWLTTRPPGIVGYGATCELRGTEPVYGGELPWWLEASSWPWRVSARSQSAPAPAAGREGPP